MRARVVSFAINYLSEGRTLPLRPRTHYGLYVPGPGTLRDALLFWDGPMGRIAEVLESTQEYFLTWEGDEQVGAHAVAGGFTTLAEIEVPDQEAMQILLFHSTLDQQRAARRFLIGKLLERLVTDGHVEEI